jgi:hypothetical protein
MDHLILRDLSGAELGEQAGGEADLHTCHSKHF